MHYTITIRATSITVDHGYEAMETLLPLLDMMTYEDEFVEETKTLGFMYDGNTDTLYLHKGVDIEYMRKLLMDVEIKFDLFHPYQNMNFEYEEIIAPRDDDQVDVINFIAGLADHQGNYDASQIFLVKKPGFGKLQPYSSKIPTPTEQGYTLMGDLKVGDYVFDQMGRKTKVLKIFEQGVCQVWKVTFVDNRTALCGIEHLWAAFIDDEEKYTVYDTKELLNFLNDGHAVYIPTYKKENGNRLQIKDISNTGRMEQCRCILVDNPDHLYLTDDFIVTHNTFCSGVGLCKIGVKTLIIMHRDSLRGQWDKSLNKMCGLTSREVHEISSTEELAAIAYGTYKPNYDVYLMTHATFRAGLKRLNTMDDAANITKNLGIGLKIVDEAHLEFRDTLLMDFCFNVKRNLYLTATDGRSSKDENSIFRHVFASAVYYKPSAFLTDSNRPKKWTDYISIAVNTHCNPNMYKYRVNGGRGMNSASYGKWVIAYDKKKTHFKCCKEILKMIYDKDPHAKVLVFMPLIDLCQDFAFYVTSELDKDQHFMYDLDIRTINSKNSKKDNDRAKHSDVIVTTIGSCGTGTDIPGITAIISCTPYCSHITAEQVFGRIRYCGKVCQYYDLYDTSVPMDMFWWRARSKKLKHLALNVKQLSWTEDEEE